MTINKITVICLVFLALSLHSYSEIVVTGVVYSDENENGMKDKLEKGLYNIPVSNGRDVVLTDENGNFRLISPDKASVFPILPSDYSFPANVSRIPNENFKFITVSDNRINFGLKKVTYSDRFRFAAVGDIQLGDDKEVNFAAKSIGAELALRSDCDLNLMLGDLVNDDPDYLPVAKDLFKCFKAPTWTVYGNHDRMVVDTTTSDRAYCKVFGSSVYAFNRGQVHFIVLNNVFPKGKKGYEGRLTQDELLFVENDLKYIPDNCLIIILLHIPLIHTLNKNALLSLLEKRNRVLVLSGHTHTVNRYFIKNKGNVIQELGVGASCGNWWTGEKNEMGTPNALMSCGSFPNYFLIDVNKVNYTFHYKAIGLDSTRQMGIWIEPTDTANATSATVVDHNYKVLANVYGGSDSTIVTLKIDDSPDIKMSKTTSIVSPNVQEIINLNKEKVYPTSGNTRNPLRKTPSSHLWITELNGLTSGLHHISIHAADRYGFNCRGLQIIFIP